MAGPGIGNSVRRVSSSCCLDIYVPIKPSTIICSLKYCKCLKNKNGGEIWAGPWKYELLQLCQLRNASTFVRSTRNLFPQMLSKLQKPRASWSIFKATWLYILSEALLALFTQSIYIGNSDEWFIHKTLLSGVGWNLVKSEVSILAEKS